MSGRDLLEELTPTDGNGDEEGVVEHRANHRADESNDIPDDHIIVSQEHEAGVEIVKTKPGYECEECGDVFETEEERNGHMSSHSGE